LTDTADQTVTIEQTTRIAASPATVWTFWTQPERVTEWLGVTADVVAEPGGTFRVAMENGVTMRGEFTELDPPRRLAFTFGWEQNLPGEPLAPGSTLVEVTLTPDDDGTVLVLRHFDMPATHAADHEKGWSHLVGDRLAAAVASAA
jgi:uncharacterized protein YndB with AHSA1/START domain